MEVYRIENHSYLDSRGEFQRIFDIQMEGYDNICLQQANISKNPSRYTLRGMHFQTSGPAEIKLITILSGTVWIVVSNAHLAKTQSEVKNEYFELSEASRQTLIVGSGLATGWISLSDHVTISYLMTARYQECKFSGFRFDDAFASINWPVSPEVISEKDLCWEPLR